MSPPKENGPGREVGAVSKSSGGTATTRNDSRRPTQKQRVLQLLLENDEVCGHAVFYGRERIPRFGAHLDRLKRDGYVWTKRPCDQHDHEGTGWLYRLVAVPEKRQDAGCVVCGGILGHVSTCRDLNAGQLPGMSP